METKSRLLKILFVAEDILLFFNDYFKSTSWVYYGTSLSQDQLRKSKNYLKDNGYLDQEFKLREPPDTVLSLVTKPWDKKWRLVSFDIPEKERKKRDQLRCKLEELGFKHFQRSVWISPLPINSHLKKIVNQIDNKNYLSIFIGKLYNQNSKDLAKELWEVEVWQNSAINLLSKIKSNSKINSEKKRIFWDLIINHPKIPLDLLPSNWPLEQLTAAFATKIKASFGE